MRQKYMSGGCFAAMAALWGLPLAIAANTTEELSVSLQVPAECRIDSVSALDFGEQTLLDGAVQKTATFGLKCSNTAGFSIGLDNGKAFTDGKRALLGAATGNKIHYELFMDSAGTKAWGSSATDSLAGEGIGTTQTMTVYARVNAGQTPAPDTYSDSVTLSVTY
jgi:spore coat protein U-like protein